MVVIIKMFCGKKYIYIFLGIIVCIYKLVFLLLGSLYYWLGNLNMCIILLLEVLIEIINDLDIL